MLRYMRWGLRPTSQICISSKSMCVEGEEWWRSATLIQNAYYKPHVKCRDRSRSVIELKATVVGSGTTIISFIHWNISSQTYTLLNLQTIYRYLFSSLNHTTWSLCLSILFGLPNSKFIQVRDANMVSKWGQCSLVLFIGYFWNLWIFTVILLYEKHFSISINSMPSSWFHHKT